MIVLGCSLCLESRFPTQCAFVAIAKSTEVAANGADDVHFVLVARNDTELTYALLGGAPHAKV